jgi:hypothetical protein
LESCVGDPSPWTFGEEMKSAHSTTAHDFRLSLEAGVIDRAEIVRWADKLVLTEAYDDNIAEISMSSRKTDKEIEALLGTVSCPEDYWNGLRAMLGRMHHSLITNPDRLHDFTRFLERLWIRADYDIPKDLSFIVGLEDSYQLAELGHWGAVEDVRSDLLANLARYTPTTTEQGMAGQPASSP